jgi:WS/DGAT/MGAT family acyltransferase
VVAQSRPGPAEKAVDAPLNWGSSAEMNAFEATMWRAEGVMHSPVLAMELLDTVPEWDRFVAAHEWAVRMVPRGRQRVVEAPFGLGSPRWGDDPDFDLNRHLSRIGLPEGAGWPALLEVAAHLAMGPFARARPPWQAVLVEGMPGGRGVYLLKLHHSATDGLGVGQLLTLLHSRRREPRADKPQPPARPAEHPSPLGVLGHQVRHDIGSVPSTVTGLGSAAVDALRDPLGSLRTATRWGRSLGRVLTPPNAPGSPLLAGRGAAWRFAAVDVPLGDLRASAKVAGGTVNDAYLAALLGGYRLYHEAMGIPVEAIPMAIPISVRRPGDPAGGNRIAGARFSGPVAVTDPTARIQRIRALILAAKSEPAVDTISLMSPALARLPGSVIAAIAGSQTRGNDLQATFVPGGRGELYLAGAHIERVYPFAPLPGCAAMIMLVTHGDTGCVGINLDAAAITSPELFVRCLVDGFAEVLALNPGSSAPIARI